MNKLLSLLFLWLAIIGFVVGLFWHSLPDFLASAPCITYQWQHVNVFHLIGNLLSLTAIGFGYFRLPPLAVPAALVISVAVPLVYPSVFDVPTFGLSGIIFALLGMISIFAYRKLYYHAWIASFILFFHFFGHSNSLLHILTYITGIFYAWFVTPKD